MTTRGAYVHDLRHRYSVELRPDAELDARLRALARELEDAELVPGGAHLLPRFHPHLTVGRAADVSHDMVESVRAVVGPVGAQVTFETANTFGHGRIIYLQLGDDDVARRARAALVAATVPEHLDPLMASREWVPHITVAYSVPEPTRAAALEFVRTRLPIAGSIATVEAWDLDVRPTQLVQQLTL